MGDVELRQFRYFIAVAEELHFGRAAARLRIAQSGLSQQIGKLERALNAQLLTRDRRTGVQLTEAGRAFLDHARLTVELADRAVSSVHLVANGKRGVLRVGTTVLAKLERVPRSELLKETFIEGPRNINPDLFDHIHRILFGELEPPLRLEVADLEESRRLQHVAEGKGIGLTGTPPGVQRQAVPGIVFRPLDEETPRLGYGVAWSASQASPFVDAFVDVAREVATSEAASSMV